MTNLQPYGAEDQPPLKGTSDLKLAFFRYHSSRSLLCSSSQTRHLKHDLRLESFGSNVYIPHHLSALPIANPSRQLQSLSLSRSSCRPALVEGRGTAQGREERRNGVEVCQVGRKSSGNELAGFADEPWLIRRRDRMASRARIRVCRRPMRKTWRMQVRVEDSRKGKHNCVICKCY